MAEGASWILVGWSKERVAEGASFFEGWSKEARRGAVGEKLMSEM